MTVLVQGLETVMVPEVLEVGSALYPAILKNFHGSCAGPTPQPSHYLLIRLPIMQALLRCIAFTFDK